VSKQIIGFAAVVLAAGLAVMSGCATVAPRAVSGDVSPALPVIPVRTFNLTDYGGVGDGTTLNTEAFDKAVAAVAAAGGGHLVVPKGTYLTQPFALTSHMDLHLEDGSVIQFPHDLTLYGLPADQRKMTRAQMNDFGKRVHSLISGHDLTDVSITGSGAIDGAGSSWWSLGVKDSSGVPRTWFGNNRPKLIILTNSQRLLFQGVTLRNSPMYNLAPTLCRDITVEQVHIWAPGKPFDARPGTYDQAPNTDAIDPMACQNVLIRDCDLSVGDDNVAIKAIEGPCCNILVENCRCGLGHGISIGSETYQGIHNVTVRNCTFDGTQNGIRIKSSRDRGNDLYGFSFSNITMKNVTMALSINMYYMDRGGVARRRMLAVTPHTPMLHGVHIENVTVTNAKTAGEIIGLPESCVKDITLTNVTISAQKGVTIRDATQIVFRNVQVTAATGDPVTTTFAQLDWDR